MGVLSLLAAAFILAAPSPRASVTLTATAGPSASPPSGVGLDRGAAERRTSAPSGSPLRLRWTAPAACPGVAAIERRVEELVGARLGGAHDLSAVGFVEPGGPPWRVDLALRSRAGAVDRRLESEDCAALGEAVAVILALSIDAEPAPRVPIRPLAAAERAPDRSPPIEWGLGAVLELGSGHLPGLAAGSAVRAHVRLSEVRLSFGLVAWLPTYAGDLEARTRLGLGAVEARLGRPVRAGLLEVAPELVVELGRLEARGLGSTLEAPASRSALHLSAGGGLGVALRLFGPLWARARADLQLAVARPEILVVGLGPLFRTEPFSPRGALGLELRLD